MFVSFKYKALLGFRFVWGNLEVRTGVGDDTAGVGLDIWIGDMNYIEGQVDLPVG